MGPAGSALKSLDARAGCHALARVLLSSTRCAGGRDRRSLPGGREESQKDSKARFAAAGYPELDRCEGQTTPRTATDAPASAAKEETVMKRLPIALTVAVVALMSATSGFAQQGVKINGVAANTTVANGNTAAAIGLLSEARQNIGVINGNTTVNGVLSNTTVANGNTSAAIGLLSESCQNIGVVGDPSDACD
jgi:hypothetical protein